MGEPGGSLVCLLERRIRRKSKGSLTVICYKAGHGPLDQTSVKSKFIRLADRNRETYRVADG